MNIIMSVPFFNTDWNIWAGDVTLILDVSEKMFEIAQLLMIENSSFNYQIILKSIVGVLLHTRPDRNLCGQTPDGQMTPKPRPLRL